MKNKMKKFLAVILVLTMIIPSGIVVAGAENTGETQKFIAVDDNKTPAYGYYDIDDNRHVEPIGDFNGYDIEILKTAAESKYIPEGILTDAYPSIRNQNPYGTCWAFTATALAELSVLKNDNRLFDLSELHTAYFAFNNTSKDGKDTSVTLADNYLNQGGNLMFTYNSFMNWIGVADEITVPYGDAYDTLSEGISADLTYEDVVHLRNAYILNYDGDRAYIKQLIKDLGGVGISYYEDSMAYDNGTNSYYSSHTGSNHAVTIVGWDDEKETKAPEKGAWLIRNSWGSNAYNHYGYFWMSYDEPSISKDVYAYDCVSDKKTDSDEFYDNNYQYDGAIWSSYGSYGSSTIKTANVFTAEKEYETIKAVGFDADNTNYTYTVDVYTNLTDKSNPESGIKQASQSGSRVYSGYNTIKLDKPVLLSKGTDFSVVVTITASSGQAYFVAESSISQDNYIKVTASASKGQSFVMYPYGDVWMDYGESYNKNLRIKAYTDNTDKKDVNISVKDVSIEPVKSRIIFKGDGLQLTAMITPETAVNKNVTWSSSDDSIATVSKTGYVQAKAPGMVLITVKTDDGGHEDSIWLDVKSRVEYISLEQSLVFLDKDGSTYLDAEYSPEDAYIVNGFEWSSSDTSVATVSDTGQVKAAAPGVADITVKMGSLSASATVVVMPSVTYTKSDKALTVNWDEFKNGKKIVISDNSGNILAEYTNGETQFKYSDEGVTNLNIDIVYGDGASDYVSYDVAVLYFISYELNGGEFTEENSFTYNVYDKNIVINDPEKSGYVFGGWYYDSNFKNKMTAFDVAMAKNVTLYAKWIKKLPAPTISGVTNASSGITVKWNKVDGADGYAIYKKTGSGSYKKIATITGNKTFTYTDKSVSGGTSYSYSIKAFVEGVYSDYSSGKAIKRLTTPSITSVSNSSSGITVNWGKVTGASGYYVYRKTGSGSYKKIATINKSSTVSYLDKTAAAGITYTYAVKAYSGGYTSSYYSKSIKRLTTAKISSVTNASSGITVKWGKVTGASGYYVYKKTGSGSYKKIATINKSSTVSYTDRSVTNGTSYSYIIRVYSGSYSSANSTSKSTVRLTAPDILSCTNNKSRSITVKWNKNTKATGYQVYYKEGNTAKTVKVTGASALSKVIGSLSKNKTYRVYVRSYKVVKNTTYYSAWSASKTVKITK